MEHNYIPSWLRAENIPLPKLGLTDPDELLPDLSFEDYLADFSCISSSGLKQILNSPSHYRSYLIGKLTDEDDDKDHFRFGRALHMFVLEPARFREKMLVMPVFTGFTKDGKESALSKEAKEKKAEWLASVPPDALVLTQDEMDKMLEMIFMLTAHSNVSDLLKNSRTEVSGKWLHKPTGFRIKIRLDSLAQDKNERPYVLDLKTTRATTEHEFMMDAIRNKYLMQLALYVDGVAQITGRQVEAQALIALSKSAPHSTWLFWISEDDLAIGRAQYNHALNVLKMCVETGKFPGPQTTGQMLNLPSWYGTDALPQFDFET